MKKIFKTAPFNIYEGKKNQHIRFLVRGRFSWLTFGLQLVRGLKASEMHLKKTGPWKCDYGINALLRGTTSWSMM
jgi:hypothetical protein